ncbi:MULTISPECIES: large conductance mechanosensitive channel protein MscL [unclassified Streptococcus]|uniref:large conductance mechanosensitive channel protein MscL n=1 Tax=unclassified Streptococcus TaxID=2608887 RepID=UPI0010726F41|nr:MULTISPECIES: large conductance mechanosensitive channel protein MscL [unclassified Streptococcus]MBF0805853.1 large conductance mechanosensitive channel protein MscL [Streptococcus sp. 19428wA2_WM07]TFU28596.1 large conductance mechanosensitive channel protein MscL [Streptococcus sp. WM07]
MLKELKDFLLRGNVVDLAVAVIIGAAFGQIITSLVEDVLTPLFLNPALKAAQVEKIADLSWNGIAYGNFLSAIINFLIIGTVLFFVVKAVEKAQAFGAKNAEEEEEEEAGPSEVELLQDIKALLEKK